MQDLRSAYSLPAMNPQFPDQEHLKCPRCDSDNTKFCYYNNYNLSQPRHFCKNCRRYWTKGGTLRNIPVGGGTRKTTKRSSSSSARRSAASASPPAPPHPKTETSSPPASDSVKMVMSVSDHVMDVSGSFGSLLGSGGGQFGNFFLDESPPAMQVAAGRNGGYDDDRRSSGIVNQSGGWNGDINGWPHDLSIYTPGASSSTFH